MLSSSYLIEQNYFVHIIEYLVTTLSTESRVQCNRLFHRMPELKEVYTKIDCYCCLKKLTQRTCTLEIVSNTVDFCYSSSQFNEELKARHEDLQLAVRNQTEVEHILAHLVAERDVLSRVRAEL